MTCWPLALIRSGLFGPWFFLSPMDEHSGRRAEPRDAERGALAGVDRGVQARLVDQQRACLRAAAVDRLGELDGLERVDQARALVVGGRAQVGGGAHDDLLD